HLRRGEAPRLRALGAPRRSRGTPRMHRRVRRELRDAHHLGVTRRRRRAATNAHPTRPASQARVATPSFVPGVEQPHPVDGLSLTALSKSRVSAGPASATAPSCAASPPAASTPPSVAPPSFPASPPPESPGVASTPPSPGVVPPSGGN